KLDVPTPLLVWLVSPSQLWEPPHFAKAALLPARSNRPAGEGQAPLPCAGTAALPPAPLGKLFLPVPPDQSSLSTLSAKPDLTGLNDIPVSSGQLEDSPSASPTLWKRSPGIYPAHLDPFFHEG